MDVAISLGEWCAGSPPSGTAWRSERFRDLTGDLLSTLARDGFKHSAMVWHRDRGFDGELLPDDIIEAIQASVRFAALDANDHLRDDPNAGFYIATSENAELYVQPIDVDHGGITHRRGGALKRVISGGLKIGQKSIPLPDAVVPIQGHTLVSKKLSQAVFSALGSSKDRHRRVRIALEWHAVAMSNPRAVTMQQRIIALKTGFEALTGTSESREGARRLRRLFEVTCGPHVAKLPWPGLLWSPKERTDLVRVHTAISGKKKHDMRSELEDWFMTLATARNEVIHDGELSVFEYQAPSERPLSRYQGTLFWIGERMLREAIKASLGAEILLCGLLADWSKYKELEDELAAVVASGDGGAVEVAPPEEPKSAPAAPQTRDLASLFTELGCSSANEVELTKAVAAASASEEVALKNAMAVRDLWVASVRDRSVPVSTAEKELLEHAGAEEALPKHFTPCE